MTMTQERESNPNWKGGKIVDQRGYVLVKVGVEHHLADVRGYAYEHRLVAEEKLGRKLLPGEQVHHRNGDTSDNDPDNIVVTGGVAGHKVFHRRPGSKRRLPGEDNPVAECACGCGEKFDRYDQLGRPRRFVPGHSRRGTGGKPRTVVMCACGCGAAFLLYDPSGRPRKYITGHNMKRTP